MPNYDRYLGRFKKPEHKNRGHNATPVEKKETIADCFARCATLNPIERSKCRIECGSLIGK